MRTVQEILANPVYNGRMVWNRQPTERALVDPNNPGLGHRDVRGGCQSANSTPRWALP